MKRLILLFIASTAQAAQLYYSPFTVNHTLVPSTQTDFPVLVSVTDTRLKTTGNGGHVADAQGDDIRPYSDTGLTSALTFEREFYDAAAGTVVMWVKVPSLSSSVDYVIYLGYGDTALTTDGSSNTTWDSNYLGVWHLGDGTTLSLSDSTSNTYTLTNTATVGATTGKVDGGAGTFNGTTQALNTTSNITMSGVNKVTLSMWINIPAYNNSDDILAEWSTNFNSINGLLVDPNSSSTTQWDLSMHSFSPAGYNSGHFTRPATGVHYCVFTFDRTTGTAIGVAAWIDGVSQTMTQDNATDLASGVFSDLPLYLAARGASSLAQQLTYMDEVRLSKVLRAADWTTTEYNNQSAPTTFAPIGTEVNIGGVPANTGNLNLFFFLP